MVKQTKFEGRCEGLRGFIYDLSVKQADHYSKTTKEIAEYCNTSMKYGGPAVRTAILTGKTQAFDMPKAPSDKMSRLEEKIWDKEYERYQKNTDRHEENLQQLYSLAWGQCSEAVQAKLEGLPAYEDMCTAADGLSLMQAIKTISYNFETTKYQAHALYEASRQYFLFYQDADMTDQKFLEKFQSLTEVIEHCGGSIGEEPGMIDAVSKREYTKDYDALDGAQKKDVRLIARQEYLGTAFVLKADRGRYHKLVMDLENSHTQGVDKYPKSVTNAYNMVTHWKSDTPTRAPRSYPRNHEGMSFNTDGTRTGKSHITCFKCQKKGHYSYECTEGEQANREGTQLLTMSDESESPGEVEDNDDGDAWAFTQLTSHAESLYSNKYSMIPDTWILLDNQATCNMVKNGALLRNIRETDSTLTIHTNAGTNMLEFRTVFLFLSRPV